MLRQILIELSCDGCHKGNYVTTKANLEVTDQMLDSIDWIQLAGGHYCGVECVRRHYTADAEKFTEQLTAALAAMKGNQC